MDCRSSTHSMVSLLSLLIAALAVCSLPASSYIIGSTSQQKSFSYSSKIRFATAVKRMSGRGTHREDGSPVTLYLLPTPSSISAGNHRRVRDDTNRGRGSSTTTTPRNTSTSRPFMSSSVLSPKDTLPSFHTAHGLLSPEVFMRIADTYPEEGSSVHKFLTVYRRKGPMACLGMLSDPVVLPELTKAMREIL